MNERTRRPLGDGRLKSTLVVPCIVQLIARKPLGANAATATVTFCACQTGLDEAKVIDGGANETNGPTIGVSVMSERGGTEIHIDIREKLDGNKASFQICTRNEPKTQGPPATPTKPGRHSHCKSCVLATSAVFELGGHIVHVTGPILGLKEPRAHGAQDEPFAPVNPGRQAHCEAELDPGGDQLLAGQDVQAPEPKLDLYFAEIHAEHAVPFAPEYPGMQSHCASEELPGGDQAFDGQPPQGPLPELDL